MDAAVRVVAVEQARGAAGDIGARELERLDTKAVFVAVFVGGAIGEVFVHDQVTVLVFPVAELDPPRVDQRIAVVAVPAADHAHRGRNTAPPAAHRSPVAVAIRVEEPVHVAGVLVDRSVAVVVLEIADLDRRGDRPVGGVHVGLHVAAIDPRQSTAGGGNAIVVLIGTAGDHVLVGQAIAIVVDRVAVVVVVAGPDGDVCVVAVEGPRDPTGRDRAADDEVVRVAVEIEVVVGVPGDLFGGLVDIGVAVVVLGVAYLGSAHVGARIRIVAVVVGLRPTLHSRTPHRRRRAVVAVAVVVGVGIRGDGDRLIDHGVAVVVRAVAELRGRAADVGPQIVAVVPALGPVATARVVLAVPVEVAASVGRAVAVLVVPVAVAHLGVARVTVGVGVVAVRSPALDRDDEIAVRILSH